MSEKCTVEGRLRSNIWRKKDDPNKDEPIYLINLVISDEKYVKRLEAIRDHVLEEKFGKKIPKGLQDWVVKLRQIEEEDEQNPDGIMYLNLKTATEFKRVVKREGSFDTISEDDDLAKPGDVVAVSVTAFVSQPKQGQSFKPSVAIGINSLMHVSMHPDGRTSGPVLDTSDFDDFESDESTNDENWDD